MIIILFLSISFLPTVDQKVRHCPDDQVIHVEPETKLAFCCIPVQLLKGHEYVHCQINGTRDSIRKCQDGLFQEDETTTASEATCIAELQCLAKENLKIQKCDAEGKNCKPVCVCNFPGEFCGKLFYDCGPFPKDCPKEYVEKDCSCNRPDIFRPPDGSAAGITIKQPGSDVISQKDSTIPSYKVPFIPTDGKPNNNTAIVLNVENNTSLNDNASGPGIGPEKSGFSIPVVNVVVVAVVVIVVIIGIVVFCNKEYRDSLLKKVLCIYRNCRRSGLKPVPKRPVAAVKPLVQNSSQADGGAQSFHLLVVYEDIEDTENVDAQPIPSKVLPIDGINDEQAVAFVEPPSNVSDQSEIVLSIEGWVPLSTISSNSFGSNDTDQNFDNTHVKQVECVIDETERKQVVENQHNGVEENPQSGTTNMPPVDSEFPSSNFGWSSFSSVSSNHMRHPHEDFDRQKEEGDKHNKDDHNEDEPQETDDGCEESPFLVHKNN